jgi:hypothetical protein
MEPLAACDTFQAEETPLFANFETQGNKADSVHIDQNPTNHMRTHEIETQSIHTQNRPFFPGTEYSSLE